MISLDDRILQWEYDIFQAWITQHCVNAGFNGILSKYNRILVLPIARISQPCRFFFLILMIQVAVLSFMIFLILCFQIYSISWVILHILFFLYGIIRSFILSNHNILFFYHQNLSVTLLAISPFVVDIFWHSWHWYWCELV